ncbi:sigma-E factor negative regulatory protein [Marilutibacter alkalisoli]|nr:sigma-E factor negative regulatory protein [Lysobacter alkalisoli]
MQTNPPLNSSSPSRDDRETLCALFDGELDAAAARFAHRRLEHDLQWREACGRWQLAGDVLRRQASGVAPMGFADRIARALKAEADEAAHPAVASAGGAMRSTALRRRWIPGAALAASVAVAALLVTRPADNPDATPTSLTTVSGSEALPVMPEQTGQASVEALLADSAETATPPGDPVPVEVAVAAAATAVAAADPARRSSERASRNQVSRRTPRGSEASAPMTTAEDLAAPIVEAVASLPVPENAANPFAAAAVAGDADAAESRPWPRAVLPGYGERSGYSVGYGQMEPVSPSFYPFEPRTSEPEIRPPTDESSAATPPER